MLALGVCEEKSGREVSLKGRQKPEGTGAEEFLLHPVRQRAVVEERFLNILFFPLLTLKAIQAHYKISLKCGKIIKKHTHNYC